MNQTDKRIEILRALGYTVTYNGVRWVAQWPNTLIFGSESEELAWKYGTPDPFTDLNAAFECVAKAREWGWFLIFTNSQMPTAAFHLRMLNERIITASDESSAAAIAEAFHLLLIERGNDNGK